MRYTKYFFCLPLLWLISCAPDISVYPVDTYRGDVLNASYVGGFSTKTEIGDMTTSHSYAEIVWSANDSISLLYNQVNAKLVTSQGSKNAVFYPDPALEFDGSAYLGLYPYNPGATALFSGTPVINTVIPDSQKGYAGTFDPAAQLAAGYAVSYAKGSLDMQFYNVCSGICFTLESGNYNRIVFRGNNNESLAGPVTISMGTPSSPAASAVAAEAKTSVELTPGGDNASFNADVEYYISFLPGSFPYGFTMVFYGDGDPVARTCTASVVFRRGAFGWVTAVDNKDKLAAIRDGELLSQNGPANCYIITSPGAYKFPIVQGNEPDAVISNAVSASVLWETCNTTSAPESSIVDKVSINRGYVYFDVPSPITDGNALIAVKDENGEILWSWHIWVSNGYNPESTKQTLMYKVGSSTVPKPSAMMDRNVGALSNSPLDGRTNGLFYQWGRKDPFPGAAQIYYPDSEGGSFIAMKGAQMEIVPSATANTTVDYAIKHPTQFYTSTDGHWLQYERDDLWGASKTIYDPCPPGWKVPRAYVLDDNFSHVPAEEAWSYVTWSAVKGEGYGYGVYFSAQSGQAWYPKNGFLAFYDGVLYMVGQSCCYWSSSPNEDKTFSLEMAQTMDGTSTLNAYKDGKVRGEGHSVRCIAEK